MRGSDRLRVATAAMAGLALVFSFLAWRSAEEAAVRADRAVAAAASTDHPGDAVVAVEALTDALVHEGVIGDPAGYPTFLSDDERRETWCTSWAAAPQFAYGVDRARWTLDEYDGWYREVVLPSLAAGRTRLVSGGGWEMPGPDLWRVNAPFSGAAQAVEAMEGAWLDLAAVAGADPTAGEVEAVFGRLADDRHVTVAAAWVDAHCDELASG